MGNEQKPGINNVSPECAPFYLLSLREREVLQHTADGDSPEETRGPMGISLKTVEAHRRNIGNIGMSGIGRRSRGFNDYPNQTKITLLALIQDGIVNDYVTHKLPEEPVIPLSPREAEVLELVLRGMTSAEIREKLFISINTIDTHRANINAKLQTHNTYQAVARATYLKVHNMWPSPIDGKVKL